MTEYLIYTDGGRNYRGNVTATSHRKAAEKLSEGNPDNLKQEGGDVMLGDTDVALIPASAVQGYFWKRR